MSDTKGIKGINPIAKALLQNRRHRLVVPSKKGKGSFNRAKEKVKNAKAQTESEG